MTGGADGGELNGFEDLVVDDDWCAKGVNVDTHEGAGGGVEVLVDDHGAAGLEGDRLGVASTTQNLAILDSRLGRHEEAEAAMRRVLRIREATEPGATPNHARTLSVLASVLWAAGKAREGEARYRQAIAMERDMAPVPDQRVAQVLSGLIDWLERDGRFREAIEPAIERAARADPCTPASRVEPAEATTPSQHATRPPHRRAALDGQVAREGCAASPDKLHRSLVQPAAAAEFVTLSTPPYPPP